MSGQSNSLDVLKEIFQVILATFTFTISGPVMTAVSTRPSTVSTNDQNYILTSETRHITEFLHTSIFTEKEH